MDISPKILVVHAKIYRLKEDKQEGGPQSYLEGEKIIKGRRGWERLGRKKEEGGPASGIEGSGDWTPRSRKKAKRPGQWVSNSEEELVRVCSV